MSLAVSNVLSASSTVVASISDAQFKQKVPSERAQHMAFLTLFGSAYDAVVKGAKVDFPCPLRLRAFISLSTHTIYGVDAKNILAASFDALENSKLSIEEQRDQRNKAIDALALTAHTMLQNSQVFFKKELDAKVLIDAQEGYKRVWTTYDSAYSEVMKIRTSLRAHLPQAIPTVLIPIIFNYFNPFEDRDHYLTTISVVPIVKFLSSRLDCSSTQAKVAVLQHPDCPKDPETQKTIVGHVEECYQAHYYNQLYEAIGPVNARTLEDFMKKFKDRTDKPNTNSLHMDENYMSIFKPNWNLTKGHDLIILNGNEQTVFTTSNLPPANLSDNPDLSAEDDF